MKIKEKLDEIKEKVSSLFRSTKRDLKKEINRVWDELQELKPGTKMYKEVQADYNALKDRETKLKEVETKVTTCVLGGAVGTLCYIGYRLVIEHTNDPFFRDIGDKLAKIGLNGGK